MRSSLPYILCVIASTGCKDANRTGRADNSKANNEACVEIEPTDPGRGFAPVSGRQRTVQEQHAVHNATAILVWDEPFENITLLETGKSRLRRLSWRFRIEGGHYQAIQLVFRRNLGGLKVDATAYTDTGAALQLLDGKRLHGRVLEVSWPNVHVRALLVRVHLHLHDVAVIEKIRVGHRHRCRQPDLDEVRN